MLQAQQEVENNLVAFLNTQDQAALLQEAAEAAKQSLELAMVQYKEGDTDYTTVLTAQQALLSQQDSLASAEGQVPQSLVGIYRALGGGWEIRQGNDFIPEKIRQEMTRRTDWGDLLKEQPVKPAAVEETGILPPLPRW